MTPFGMLMIFVLLLLAGIGSIFVGAVLAGIVFLFGALIMAILIIKQIIDANDQSNDVK